MGEVWTGIWEGMQHLRFRQEPYVWKLYEMLLPDYRWKGKRVLEIGCGTGVNTALMAARGGRVTFVDQSAAALALARQTMEAWGLDGEYVQGDAFELDLGRRFDVVHSEGVVEHFLGERRQEILNIHVRCAKPGGKVVIIVPHAKCPGYRLGKWIAEQTGTWIYGGEYPYTATELRARIGRAGAPCGKVIGGELLFGCGWVFCPLWLHSTRLLERSIAMPAGRRMVAWNYNNRWANTWGRVIGCVGHKSGVVRGI